MKKNKSEVFSPLASISLSGAEFGDILSPDNYTYPTEDEIIYYKDQGMTMFRFPFRWERLEEYPFEEGQTEFTEDLDKVYAVLDAAKRNDMKVLLDMHNYCRYDIEVDGEIETNIVSDDPDAKVSVQKLVDFWSALANYCVNNEFDNVLYGIMNEPYRLDGDDDPTLEQISENGILWKDMAERVIYAVSESDPHSPIVVGGYEWSSAERWITYNSNIHELAYLEGVDNPVIFEAHCYFDKDSSGHYYENDDDPGMWDQGPNDMDIGVRRVAPFVAWCYQYGVSGFVGEFGIPYGADYGYDGVNMEYYEKWKETMERFIGYLESASIPYCYWSAGDWWYNSELDDDYILSCHPLPDLEGEIKPQLQIMLEYMESKRKPAKMEM